MILSISFNHRLWVVEYTNPENGDAIMLAEVEAGTKRGAKKAFERRFDNTNINVLDVRPL